MKAITLGRPPGLATLSLADIDDPGAPGPGHIRVALKAGSLNYHDYAVAIGAIPAPKGRIPLSDGAGVVEAVGEGVTAFAVGDAVVSCFFPYWTAETEPHGNFSHVPGDGIDGYAREAVVTPARWFTRAPKAWSHLEASTLPCAALTAWRALVTEGKLKPGDTVLVLGTGGVAIFALQMGKAMGARVVVTSSSDAKLERARTMGADFTVNYKADPEWGKTVRDWTGKRGVDITLEIGGPGSLAQSIIATRIGGLIAMIGILSGIKGEVPTLAMMAKHIRLQGLVVDSPAHQLDMVRGLETMGIRPVIDKTYPLAELAEAFRHQEGAQHFGKICVEI